MIALLLTPVGKYFAATFVVVMIFGSAYVKIRSDAVREVVAQSTTEALKRTQDAIAAGDSVDVSPERLLENDGSRRD
jgi:hypothetical protein